MSSMVWTLEGSGLCSQQVAGATSSLISIHPPTHAGILFHTEPLMKMSPLPRLLMYSVAPLSFRVLLVATGLWVPHKVDFVGSDLVEGYESISTNPEDYKNQAVLILGKGNSAFETGQSLLGSASVVHMLSANPVRLAWQTHYVGDLR